MSTNIEYHFQICFEIALIFFSPSIVQENKKEELLSDHLLNSTYAVVFRSSETQNFFFYFKVTLLFPLTI